MTISRKLAVKMNGLLELEDSASGKGSSFVLTLPAPATLRIEKPLQARQMQQKNIRKPLEGLRFLLVDDAPDNQVLLQHLLNNYGAKQIDLAEDGVGGR